MKLAAPTTDTQLRPIDEEAIRYRIRKAEKAREGQGHKTFPKVTDTYNQHPQVWIGLNRGGQFLCMEAYTGRWDSRGLEVYLTAEHPAEDQAGAYVKFAAILEGSNGPTT